MVITSGLILVVMGTTGPVTVMAPNPMAGTIRQMIAAMIAWLLRLLILSPHLVSGGFAVDVSLYFFGKRGENLYIIRKNSP
jgi:hypothetical protein